MNNRSSPNRRGARARIVFAAMALAALGVWFSVRGTRDPEAVPTGTHDPDRHGPSTFSRTGNDNPTVTARANNRRDSVALSDILLTGENGALRVKVTDARAPLARNLTAVVTDADGKRSALAFDANGCAQLANIPAGPRGLEVRSGALERSMPIEIASGRVTEVSVAIPRGFRIEGEVRHMSKGPLAGAIVKLHRRTAAGDDRLVLRTDAHGQFRLDGVPAGRYAVAVISKGLGAVPYGTFQFEVRSGGPSRGEFELGHPRIAGTVVDIESGEPIANARVTVQQPVVRSRLTDDRGCYRFDDLPAGDYVVLVEKEGYAPLTADWKGIAQAETRTGKLALRRAATIRIHATDSLGQPVTGRLVLRAEAGGARRTINVVADGQGLVIVRRIGPGRHTLSLAEPDYPSPPPGTIVEILPGENNIHLRVARLRGRADEAAAFAGVVTDPDAQPVAAVRVWVHGNPRNESFTNVKGEFSLARVPDGEHAVFFEKGGYVTRLLKGVMADPQRSGRLDVTLERAVSLRLVITDSSNRPVAGVMLLVRRYGDLGNIGERVEADRAGEIVYRKFGAGGCGFSILNPLTGERASVRQGLRPGENRVSVRLK